MGDWIKKIIAVICLTLLIWAWAFLSLQGEYTWVAVLKAAPIAVKDYLITFNDGKEQIDNLKLTFKGAPVKISELQQKYRNEKMEFSYDPKEFEHNSDDTFTLDLVDFIKRHPKTREYALTLESCVPETVTVHVEKLIIKRLTIQCLDETGAPVRHETIDPAQIDIAARQDYNGPAYIMLTAQQMERARKLPVSEHPYVEISAGSRRYSDQTVKITLPATEPLKDQVIQPMIGYLIGPNMLNKYKIEIVNESDLKTIRNIRATEKAFEAYRKQRFHILIEIRDGDESLTEIPPRAVIYNFPTEFLKSGQIESPNPPLQVQVRLTPLAAPATPSTTTLLPLPGG